MTGDSPVLDRPALWDALSHMQIEVPGAACRFEEALAREQGWPLAFAERVADEYCGFLYLAATAGFEVTPSDTVDKAWHLHLQWPHYRDVLCGKILGRPLEHRPGTGAPDEDERYRRQYEETLALYEPVFGKPPPADIWPLPSVNRKNREEDPDALEQGQALGRRVALGSLAGGAAAVAFGEPVIGIILVGVALVVFLLAQPSAGVGAQDRKSSGNCGGSGCGGGGGGGDSSDGCASCGGSCGGGGGCGGGGD
ncbi:MAG TPA: hypothetical protein VE053_07100 [Allosphingosinicella sp.]|nr:hypothetical protein [Allosphingosinicella sp.]